jgi:RING-box protein 1
MIPNRSPNGQTTALSAREADDIDRPRRSLVNFSPVLTLFPSPPCWAVSPCTTSGAQEIVRPDTGQGSKKKEGRFQIKKWNAVAMWSWAICTDTCAICRNNLYEASIDYQANPNGDPEHPGLSIAWGQCGHVFHLDCIQRWLKTRSACPLCQKEWDFTKIEKINPSSN